MAHQLPATRLRPALSLVPAPSSALPPVRCPFCLDTLLSPADVCRALETPPRACTACDDVDE
jgi:hypothetical protein